MNTLAKDAHEDGSVAVASEEIYGGLLGAEILGSSTAVLFNELRDRRERREGPRDPPKGDRTGDPQVAERERFNTEELSDFQFHVDGVRAVQKIPADHRVVGNLQVLLSSGPGDQNPHLPLDLRLRTVWHRDAPEKRGGKT